MNLSAWSEGWIDSRNLWTYDEWIQLVNDRSILYSKKTHSFSSNIQ